VLLQVALILKHQATLAAHVVLGLMAEAHVPDHLGLYFSPQATLPTTEKDDHIFSCRFLVAGPYW
jgi:hypothetical protein